MAGWLQAVAVIALVGALHVPLGDYMARAFTAPRHWRVERVIYRLGGMDPDTDQPWAATPTVVLARAVNAELDAVDDGDGPWDRIQKRVTEEHIDQVIV